ncbi:MAG: transglutaminase-like domain-containing protein [Burkholderiaceae bacterium]|nr:transglutaminase-like domain-containing protein [Burkholderiaceae bacterium]
MQNRGGTVHGATDAFLDYWRMLVRSDDSLPLFEAALSIAQDEYPELPMHEVLARVDGFALALRRRVARLRQPIARVDALREHFADELGFRGNANDFHDPENSYLNRVIERRLGIPISLSVLYLEIAELAGVQACGVGFPGHFLVRHDVAGRGMIVDVFAGARVLTHDELEYRLLPYAAGDREEAGRMLGRALPAASGRQILARMLRNLRAIHRERGDARRLAAVERRLVVLEETEA